MNSNEVLLEVGRMHLQIIQMQGVIDKQGAQIAQLQKDAAERQAPPTVEKDAAS